MSETAGPIASAVIVPELEHPPRSPPTKRRRSSAASHDSKRPRISEEVETRTSSARRDSTDVGAGSGKPQDEKSRDRAKSSIQEEKKRGQRLFGGLLSTLSQRTPSGQQKRRLEIEKRQQERAKQQKADDEGRRAEKLANLQAKRKEEQIVFQGQAMKTRHSNTLAMAHFLSTSAKPKLYYKPWEMLPQDEERIKRQIADAKDLITRETEEFNRQHPQRQLSTTMVEDTETVADSTSKETVGTPHAESPPPSKDTDTTNPPPTQALLSDNVETETEKKALEEHNGEIVVEDEEDTVIY